MIKFEYQARDKTGQLQVGFIEAEDRDSAARKITADNLYILALVEVDKRGMQSIINNIFNRVTQKDVVIFTRQFATLLESDVSLSESLRTLAAQTRNIFLKEAIIWMQKDVDSGLSLSQAMGRHENIFTEFYINMLRSAEVTGRVDEVTNFIADYLEKQAILASKVRNALIYPIFLVSFLFIVVMFMSIAVFPQIESVFQELGTELPAMTRALIGLGAFLTNWWWAIFIGGIFTTLAFKDYFKSKEGKVFLDEIILRMPMFNQILKNMYVARFADSISVLIKGGVSIVQAIEITARTIGSAIYGEILMMAADEVKKGALLSQALAKHPKYFPPLVSQMLAVGEQTGKMDVLLKKVSSFYGREVEDLVSGLVEFIQPILMIIVGIVVGILFVSILTPIFQFVSTGI